MKINWKRVGFVLTHALTATIISRLMMVILGSSLIEGTVAALLFLIGKEFGEFVGKAKAKGVFVNDVAGNLAELKDALDDPWQLWQTVGAAVIGLIANAALSFII